MNVPNAAPRAALGAEGSPRLINADAKEAELRGKLEKYLAMVQTDEVKQTVRLIRKCIAELRDTPTYDGEIRVTVLAEDVVRCEDCCNSKEIGGRLQCMHPHGMRAVEAMEYCSKGVMG